MICNVLQLICGYFVGSLGLVSKTMYGVRRFKRRHQSPSLESVVHLVAVSTIVNCLLFRQRSGLESSHREGPRTLSAQPNTQQTCNILNIVICIIQTSKRYYHCIYRTHQNRGFIYIVSHFQQSLAMP